MNLVRGDKGSLSNMPSGMKTMGMDLVHTQTVSCADMFNGGQRLAAAARSRFTLAEHISTSAVPHGVIGKIFQPSNWDRCSHAQVDRTQAEGDAGALCMKTHSLW